MIKEQFIIGNHNSHYDGAYSNSEIEWRRLGAADKADNVEHIVQGRDISKILEVGCGTGAVLAEIADRGIGEQYVGIDMSDPKDHMDQRAKDFDLHVYDGKRLPYDDNQFDLVIASHVVEHVPDPRGFLQELNRVSSSLVYVEVPCEVTVRLKRSAIQQSLNIGHINGYTPEYFMILLQTSGLNVIDFEIFDHSVAVQQFGVSKFRADLIIALRKTALKISPKWASRLFCYHCGALIDASQK